MHRRSFLSLFALGLASTALARCGGVTPLEPSADAATGTPVTVTFVSASLSDDCGEARAGAALADCAPAADAGAGLWGGCGGFCRQSSVQLLFAAGAGDASARVSVTAVYLLDAETGARLDTLTAREPTRWDEATSAYVAWDQSVAPSSEVRGSYKLSAPNWAALDGSGARRSYQRRLRLEVVLRVDGAERTVRSGEITREPEVVT